MESKCGICRQFYVLWLALSKNDSSDLSEQWASWHWGLLTLPHSMGLESSSPSRRVCNDPQAPKPLGTGKLVSPDNPYRQQHPNPEYPNSMQCICLLPPHHTHGPKLLSDVRFSVWYTYLHIVGQGEGSLWGLFYKSTNPIHKALPHDLSTSQRSYLLVPSLWGWGFQHMNFRRMQTFMS